MEVLDEKCYNAHKKGFLLLSTYVDIMHQLKYWTSTYVDSMQLVVH